MSKHGTTTLKKWYDRGQSRPTAPITTEKKHNDFEFNRQHIGFALQVNITFSQKACEASDSRDADMHNEKYNYII